MDPRQSQTTHLKPPPAYTHRTPSPSGSSAASTPPSRPPISAHSSATIADSVLVQGTHPITIDAETIIHPRARILSFEGPVNIGRGCVVGERCVIGSGPPSMGSGSGSMQPGTGMGSMEGKEEQSQPQSQSIHISNMVTLSPHSTINPGVRLDEAVIIDSLATVQRGARIGRHTKICAGCHVPANTRVGEWMVLWGTGDGFGRRKRIANIPGSAMAGLDGRLVEESRLVVLRKERDALSRLLVPTGGSRRR